MTPHSQLEESMVRPSMTLHNFGEGERQQGASPRCNPQDRLYCVDLLMKQNSALANEAARTVFRVCCNGRTVWIMEKVHFTYLSGRIQHYFNSILMEVCKVLVCFLDSFVQEDFCCLSFCTFILMCSVSFMIVLIDACLWVYFLIYQVLVLWSHLFLAFLAYHMFSHESSGHINEWVLILISLN